MFELAGSLGINYGVPPDVAAAARRAVLWRLDHQLLATAEAVQVLDMLGLTPTTRPEATPADPAVLGVDDLARPSPQVSDEAPPAGKPGEER